MQEGSISPREFFEALQRHEVDVVVIGGFAVVLHGGSNITHDFDLAIIPDRNARRKLAEALNEFNPRLGVSGVRVVLDEFAFGGRFSSYFTDVGKIDIVNQFPNGITIQGLRERAETYEIFGVDVKVASLEDLIAIKKGAGRDKDQFHLAMLQELQALQQIVGDASE